MTQEDEKYYENYFDLFSTEGWKQFEQELEGAISGYHIEGLNTEQELFFAKGERSTLFRIRNFKDTIEAAYASINEQVN